MVVESEVLKAQNCALSKFSLPVHCNEFVMNVVKFAGMLQAFIQDNFMLHGASKGKAGRRLLAAKIKL